MSCTLILMRHSHAAAEHSCPDFERQLTEPGVQLAKKTGQLLRTLSVVPDLVLASAAVRTMQTAQTIVDQFESEVPVSSCNELYQAPTSAYLPVIQATTESGTETTMLIGHNPAVGTLMSVLSGQRLSVPPATLCVYSIATDDWFSLNSLNSTQATLTHLVVNGQVCPLD
jgi:phosphohistidine phosphatase